MGWNPIHKVLEAKLEEKDQVGEYAGEGRGLVQLDVRVGKNWRQERVVLTVQRVAGAYFQTLRRNECPLLWDFQLLAHLHCSLR